MENATKKQYWKNNIKVQLWTLGHSVKDLEGTPGIDYDLLVNGKVRVCIVAEDQDVRLLRRKCDVIAAEIGPEQKKMYSFVKNLGWKNPTEIFGKKGGERK